MKCLHGVIFSVWVHSYAVRLWHPFVCGVCGVFRAAQVFRLAFSNVLVRPSLILHCVGYEIVDPLVGFSSVAVPAAPVVLRGVNCCRFPSVVIQPFWLRLPVLLLLWRRALGGRLSLCILSASPSQSGLPMFAVCRTLSGWFCQGGCGFVWECGGVLGHRKNFSDLRV